MLAFETGFTNLQFVALSADTLESGDINFANMISSIQTDEARHSQQGVATLQILVEHDPVRAQWVIDKGWLREKYPNWEVRPPGVPGREDRPQGLLLEDRRRLAAVTWRVGAGTF